MRIPLWVWLKARLVPDAAEDGQDMVEYALLVGLLSVVALALVILVGPSIQSAFQTIVNGLGLA